VPCGSGMKLDQRLAAAVSQDDEGGLDYTALKKELETSWDRGFDSLGFLARLLTSIDSINATYSDLEAALLLLLPRFVSGALAGGDGGGGVEFVHDVRRLHCYAVRSFLGSLKLAQKHDTRARAAGASDDLRLGLARAADAREDMPLIWPKVCAHLVSRRFFGALDVSPLFDECLGCLGVAGRATELEIERLLEGCHGAAHYFPRAIRQVAASATAGGHASSHNSANATADAPHFSPSGIAPVSPSGMGSPTNSPAPRPPAHCTSPPMTINTSQRTAGAPHGLHLNSLLHSEDGPHLAGFGPRPLPPLRWRTSNDAMWLPHGPIPPRIGQQRHADPSGIARCGDPSGISACDPAHPASPGRFSPSPFGINRPATPDERISRAFWSASSRENGDTAGGGGDTNTAGGNGRFWSTASRDKSAGRGPDTAGGSQDSDTGGGTRRSSLVLHPRKGARKDPKTGGRGRGSEDTGGGVYDGGCKEATSAEGERGAGGGNAPDTDTCGGGYEGAENTAGEGNVSDTGGGVYEDDSGDLIFEIEV